MPIIVAEATQRAHGDATYIGNGDPSNPHYSTSRRKADHDSSICMPDAVFLRTTPRPVFMVVIFLM